MSNRRLATFASLLGLSFLVCAMVGARVIYSGNLHFVSLIWNLFLAWIPFLLALAVHDGFARGARRLPLAVGGVLWLLFLPNAPYIVTDLKYVGEWLGAPIWYDAVLVSGAAGIGLVLGFASLYLMQTVVRRAAGALNAWFFVVGMLALSSFGVYLGRFQRWNSWDVFVQPGALFADVWQAATNPTAHLGAAAVAVLFTAFLAATYLVFYSFLTASASSSSRISRDAKPSR
jgi:uncharacterized membrane protein